MSVTELKEELHEQIDNLTEDQLPLVQKFISEISGTSAKPSMREIWGELVERYDSTLRRLAQ